MGSPRDLDELAMIDVRDRSGSSSIIAPEAIPTRMAIALFSFFLTWRIHR